MSIKMLRAAARAETSDNLHEARLLVLINAATNDKNRSIAGITKLAKLDFFLRYPTYMSAALKMLRKKPPAVPSVEYEHNTVESSMIRYRYGPWDHRYRRWLRLMSAKGLVTMHREGRTVHILLTDLGMSIADSLSTSPAFNVIVDRAYVIGTTLANQTGTKLKDLTYKVVPNLSAMPFDQEIQP